MGTSRRYADSIDRRVAQREPERVVSTVSLSDDELELARFPLTRASVPIPVTAWVRFKGAALKVDARAVAWTPKAVAIEWEVGGSLQRAWVWASAVERR